MRPTRREFVAGTAAVALTSSATAAGAEAFTPEMFGAKGDGRTNDSQAFAAMSARVNSRGGGTIVLRPVTYVVGLQTRGQGGNKKAFVPVDLIHLEKCNRPIRILGNGATLRAAQGLRYGRFDPQADRALPDTGKADQTDIAVPYGAMIEVVGCSGSVEISHIELDGGVQRMRIGGKTWPSGWDANGFGIRLAGNSGPERLARVHSHHHPADGLILKPAAERTASTTISDVVSEYNGRQACSIVGGTNFLFERCKFNHTGKAGLHHPPSNGIDIEPEGQPIGNVAFTDCEFSNNGGVGVGEIAKQASDIRFTRCKLVGTTNWSAWIPAPATRFNSCLFVGTVIHVHGDPDPSQATQFRDCTFTDDPALSPTGQVFLGQSSRKESGNNVPKNIAAIEDSPNVLFSRCHFRLVRDGLLPRSAPSVIYSDCNMSQRSPRPSTPRGTYTGTTVIRGNADLQGSVIRGRVTLNGRVLPTGAGA